MRTWTVLYAVVLATPPFAIDAEPPSPPKGAVRYAPTTETQSIFVLNDRDVIDRVPLEKLESKWRHSGGLDGVSGWTSEKYRYLPPRREVSSWVGNIDVLNSLGYVQQNRGIKRKYPDGTRFDDVLKNADGKVFEHRMREKVDGRWRSRVIFSDDSARPKGYTGLKQTCAECHDRAGTGGYAVGLVPGGDTVLSDPLEWRLVR